jgi:hypothetical protein
MKRTLHTLMHTLLIVTALHFCYALTPNSGANAGVSAGDQVSSQASGQFSAQL